jgi:hypothetical protein
MYLCIFCLTEFATYSALGGHSTKCGKTPDWNIVDINIEQYSTRLDHRVIRKYFIRKYGEKCMECGWDKKHPTTGNVPLELEHIDGNSENGHIDNLKLICPNCHSLTATYKNLNKGNGRKKRRDIYRRGSKTPL